MILIYRYLRVVKKCAFDSTYQFLNVFIYITHTSQHVCNMVQI